MSPSIWTRCGGRSSAREFRCDPWRVVESQRVASTRPLVDTSAEHELLEQLLDDAKPRLPRGPDHRGLHYLLFSPFRYPPLKHGSRFGGRHEPSLWYGSEELSTSLAEAAYYRILFFEGTRARLAPHTMPMSAFQARIHSRTAVDLSSKAFAPFVGRICSPVSYGTSQPLGSEMRGAGIEVVRFPSARDPRKRANVALFTPTVFASRGPLNAPATWHCTVTGAHDVEFRHEGIARVDTAPFPRSGFVVNGALPSPGA
jgi:hypothetical protein